MANIRQQRHILGNLCPPFLRGPNAQSFLNEGIFTLYDIDSALMWQGLISRWPSFAPDDVLPYLAADRGIISGPYETNEAKRARILGWLNEAVLAGLPIGWLLAMQAYTAPTYCRVRLVTRRSNWYTLEAGAVPRLIGLDGAAPFEPCPYELGSQWPIGAVASPVERLRWSGMYQRYIPTVGNWNWDSVSNPERAACWWDCVGIVHGGYEYQDNYADLGDTWLLDDPLESVGLDEPYGTFTAMQYLASVRKSAKSVLRCLILTNEDDAFDPTTPAGDPSLPDGYWGRPGKVSAGHMVPSRSLDHRYIQGFPR